jgi:hypothetical protein
MIDFEKNIISLDLFKQVLKGLKDINRADDIIDSFSDNQFKSKKKLLELIETLNILDNKSTITIFGCWYGSILVPNLAPRVKKIVLTDLDDMTIRIAKNRFFQNLKNVWWTENSPSINMIKKPKREKVVQLHKDPKDWNSVGLGWEESKTCKTDKGEIVFIPVDK